MSTLRTYPRSVRGEPAWEIARIFPNQGYWSEEEYLALNGNHLLEFSNGVIEVLPMPTMSHQFIVAFLYGQLLAFVGPKKLGTVLFAALRIRLWKGKYREPDLVFMLAKHADRMGEEYWRGADLVMEVVSGDGESRRRDLKIKNAEYARARIPEYWIIDPQGEEITVLRLSRRGYAVHGKFKRGSRANSALLKGFEIDVDSVFSAQ